MKTPIRLQGRDLTDEDLGFIRQLIKDNPSMSRRQLSFALCEAWNWRNARGLLKDMAGRSLMLKLHERNYIVLPERKQIPSNRMTQRKIRQVDHDTTPIHQKLQQLTPVRIINVLPKSNHEALYNHLLATYHYLGYRSSVGENMKYLVLDKHNQPLACLLFGASAWSCSARDSYIGWDPEMRQQNINYTTNNTRFLILPWVKVPHLASHILGKIARQIKQDWVMRYAHPVYLLETFVELNRFLGTCYKAANWQYVGETQGRSRNDRHRALDVPIKAIHIYPLTPSFRIQLTKEQTINVGD